MLLTNKIFINNLQDNNMIIKIQEIMVINVFYIN